MTSQDPFETGFIGWLIARKFKLPLQLQVHTDFLNRYFSGESMKNKIRVFIAGRLIKKADCVRFVSARVRDSVISKFKIQSASWRTKFKILPIFIDAQKIKNAQSVSFPRQPDFTILWLGRLEREKNPLLALKVFSKVIRTIPNAELVIIGDGALRQCLKLQATRYKLQDRVLFTGWKDNIIGYYKNADVLLVTSLYEGYGMNMVEARIAGIPVVAPDVGVAKEIGAYIAKEYTTDSMSQMLIQLHSGSLPKSKEYQYPYKDKGEYLKLYKKSFERCL